MDYRREISNRNASIARYQDAIGAIKAELDQLWRDEGIAATGQDVPLGGWRNEPEPILCRHCRKEPALVAKHQREIVVTVNGRPATGQHDYYRYDLTGGEIRCQKCRDAYQAELRREADRKEWQRNHECDSYCYHDGC